MMTQRIAGAPTPKLAAIAGSAILIAESSDMSSAPSAARITGIRQVYVPSADPALTWLASRGRRGPVAIQINASVKGKEYARAIGDPSPFYLDDAVGRASEWGDIVAPPTFVTTFRDEKADTGSMLADLGVDISRILHGEQEFEHYKAIRPGETYLCRSR